MTQPLNGPELKVRLGALGLPPSWFAAHMDVTMRTVVRWFDGDSVAPNVSAELDKLSEATLDEMHRMLDKAEGSGPVVLRTYRTDDEFPNAAGWPASWHRALTSRVTEHLRAHGHTVTIEYR